MRTGGFILLAFFFVGWGLGYVFGGRGLYLLAYGAVIMFVVAVALSRRRRPLSAERTKLPRRVREGQTVAVEITLTAKQRLSMFGIVEDLHEQLGEAVRLSIDKVSPNEPWTYRYTIRPRLRGVFSVGPLVAVWSDPLGLARSKQELLPRTQILVHPTVSEVLDRPLTRQLEDPPIRPPKTKPWPAGFEFYGMRDYVAGDDLRRVVWKAVARTGRMLVRESEQGVTDQVNILLDTDPDWHQRGEPSPTFETAVKAAAAVADAHFKNGFSVSLFSSEKVLADTLRGPNARLLLLDELARVGRGKKPLAKGVELLVGRAGRTAHNVIITPYFDGQAAARTALLTARGASVRVVLIRWEESDQGSVHRATEVGAEVTTVVAGGALTAAFAHAVGAGRR